MFTAGLFTTTSTWKKRRCTSTDASIKKLWKAYVMEYCSCYFVAKLYPILLRPQGLQLTRILCPWDFPGKNTGVCCHLLLQGLFLTQRLNPWLLHWQADFFTIDPPGQPSGILLSHENEQNCVTVRELDGPREGHTEKGVRKRKTKVEYAFIYVAWRRMAQVTLFQSRNENSDIEN